MKIEKLNENKLKIMFDYTELEENNISVHSFLANSNDTQNFFEAILDIANEDLGFGLKSSNVTYETISFDNKFFVIIVTKLEKYTNFNNSNSFKDTNSTNFLYKFTDINEVFYFCNYLSLFLPTLNFKSSLYQYEDFYFIRFNLSSLDKNLRDKIVLLVSEFKDYISFSDLAFSKFEEFSSLLIKDKAVQIL